MIISHRFKYVYIGIPRTASKSVNQWLSEHYCGEFYGDHHQWRIPVEATDYLKFTVVRNPYERAASGAFGILWGDETPNPSTQVPATKPPPSSKPLALRLAEAALRGNGGLIDQKASVPEVGMNQSNYIKRAGISLALYFERLPDCLFDLPFIDRQSIHPFPHVLEKGIRPSGSFFEHFSDEDEQETWAYAEEDFRTFDYQRYDPSLPSGSPDSIRL